MDKINTIEDLANHFRGLADGSIQPFEPEWGICNHIGILIEDGTISEDFINKFDNCIYIDQYYSGWDKYSGDLYYPVPSTNELFSEEDMFHHTYDSEDCNMWTGEYGDLRKDLCLHIAKQLEKLIEVN